MTNFSDLDRLRETVQSAPEAHTGLVREMAAAQDTAGISALLDRHGYRVSVDELESLRGEQSELTDQQLQGISGGGRTGREPETARIISAIFSLGLSEIVRATS